MAAPSTLGAWLRSFTWGHVRQLDRAQELALTRACAAAPAVAEMTVDLDSTVCEVCGKAKQGAAYGHTKVLGGYHPLVAVRDDTGEMVHTRMRSGNSQRGHVRFISETLARIGRLVPEAAVTVRADAEPAFDPFTAPTRSGIDLERLREAAATVTPGDADCAAVPAFE
ncbi:MAG: transposase [Acidimicrobiaceae bacterium]|nr:transposase [Acidimicrobiaceae bacterium]